MKFVKLQHSSLGYNYIDSNDLGITILQRFLVSDLRNIRSFKWWALEQSDIGTSSNVTDLEKENGYIYLSDLYSEEKVPTKLKMTIEQFIQILDDWEIKVCKARPHEVIIKYENGQFAIETVN